MNDSVRLESHPLVGGERSLKAGPEMTHHKRHCAVDENELRGEGEAISDACQAVVNTQTP